MIRVLVPSPLFSYTGGQKVVEAEGESLAGLLRVLDARYPGMRHRIVDEQEKEIGSAFLELTGYTGDLKRSLH